MIDVILPIKDLAKAKGRLAGVLSPQARSGLVLAMLQDLLTTLRRCDLGDIWVVAQDDAVFDLGQSFGARIIREAQSSGFNHGVSAGLAAVDAERSVLVLPADLPWTEPRDIDQLIALQVKNDPAVGIVPDRHRRGTNGLYLSSPDLIAPAFGANSFFVHKVAATQVGVTASVVPAKTMGRDIDTAEDLFAFARSQSSGATEAFLRSINDGIGSGHRQRQGVA